MPFNGIGGFTLVAGNPVVTGTTISSTVNNNTMTDFANGFANCMTRDGQSAALSNIPMGGFKITGLAAGTANGEAVRWEQISSAARPENYGAVGDGVTDDTAAIQATFDNAASGSSIKFKPGSTYLLSDTITCDKEVHVIAHGASFIVDADVPAFQFTLAPTIVALTANYTPGDLSITHASTTALADGRPFKIVSDAVDPANRDSGSSTTQYRSGEWSHAATGSTTTSTLLLNPLRFSTGISPTSTAGDEAVVDAYTTALNAKLVIIPETTMSWEGGVISYEEGHAADPWSSTAFAVTGYTRPRIRGLRIARGYSAGLALRGCYRPVVELSSFSNLENNTSLSQNGYGVSDSSYMTLVDGCLFTNCRHGYTTGENGATANSGSGATLLGLGRVIGAIVSNCHGYGSADAPFDTHHGAEDVTFLNNKAIGGEGYAFTIRGRNVRVIDCEAINTKYGLLAHTEYQSGDTDDDFYVAGKPQGVTTCTVENFRAKVETLPLTFRSCRRAIVRGGEFESTDHQFIQNDGSYVSVDGEVSFTVTDYDGAQEVQEAAGEGVFTVLPIASALSSSADWTASLIMHRGAEVRVDASEAIDTGSTLPVFVADDDTCLHEIRGRVRLALSTAFSDLVTGNPASYAADTDSEIRWSVVGAADAAVGASVVGKELRAVAVDGTAWYDGTGFSNGQERLVYRARPMTTVVGTGSIISLAYVPEYAPVNYINESGHYVRYEFQIEKTNPTGVATLRTRIGTAFNADIAMGITDKKCYLVVEIYTTGANAQDVHIRAQCSPDSGVVNTATHFLHYVAETTNLGSATNLLTFDVDAVVGDSIVFRTVRVYSDISGFGL